DVNFKGTLAGQTTVGMAWLTLPGIATEPIAAKDEGLVRRDLHFRLPPVKGNPLILEIKFGQQFEAPPPNVATFRWDTKSRDYADLFLGDLPVLRYVHKAYDPADHDKTYKVFHHLYDPTGKRFLTNGGNVNDPQPKNPKDLLYPHHRGLMYAFNKIT